MEIRSHSASVVSCGMKGEGEKGGGKKKKSYLLQSAHISLKPSFSKEMANFL